MRVLMNGVPEELNLFEAVRAAEQVAGVVQLGHAHAWSLGDDQTAFQVQVAVEPALDRKDALNVLARVRAVLTESFEISHVTLELAPLRALTAVVPNE